MTTEPIVAAEAVSKVFRGPSSFLSRFRGERRAIAAVEAATIAVFAGETLALVGESGSGKSTLAKLLLDVEAPTTGVVRYKGTPLTALDRQSYREYRRSVQPVFQDPYGSLNPRMRVQTIVTEQLQTLLGVRGAPAIQRVAEVLEAVGLPARAAVSYPHEFSGGQRQRIAIARALAPRPLTLILDEPVSALDVSVRAQILNLLVDIQDATGVGYLFIAHDLAIVERISHRIAVMYLGRLVEEGPTQEVLSRPLHPYTQALVASVPIPDPLAPPPVLLSGEIPSPWAKPSGCHFRTRCRFAMDVCSQTAPPLISVGDQRRLACHLVAGTADAVAVLEQQPTIPSSP